MDLANTFMREAAGYKEYIDMSKAAKNMGEAELSFYLDRIAEDKWTHARYLHGYLCRKHMIDDRVREMWDSIQ